MKNKRLFFILSGAIIIIFACLGFRIYFLTNTPENLVFSADPEPIIPTVELGLFVAFFLVGIRTLFRGAFSCGLAVLAACVGSVMVADEIVSLREIDVLGHSDGLIYGAALAALLFVAVSLLSQIKQWRWPGWASPFLRKKFLAFGMTSTVVLCALYLTTNRPIPASTEQVRTFTQDGVQFQVSGPAIVQVGQSVEMTIRLINSRAERIAWREDGNDVKKLIVKSYFRGFYKKAVPTTEFGRGYEFNLSPTGFNVFLEPGQSKEWKVDLNQLVIMDRGFYEVSFSVGLAAAADEQIICAIDNIGLEVR